VAEGTAGAMKSHLLLFAFLALVSSASGLAQDAAAPMRRSSPTPESAMPSPTPTETPQPTQTPAPPPTVSATPQPILSPVRAPTPASTANEAASSPAPGIESDQPAALIRRAPTSRPDESPVRRPTFDLSRASWGTAISIRSLENKWQAAIKRHDINAIDQLLAEDFQATSSTGRKAGKATLLAELRKDENAYRSTRAQGMTVRSLGPDVAIVTGTATESGTTADGRQFTVSRRFTDKWERRNGRWQCVASEVSRLP